MFGRVPKNSDNTKHYEILGVSETASQQELKKAYRKAAMNNHPNSCRGGDPEKFKELAHAYEVLGDPEKREIYGIYSEKALKEGMGSAAADGHNSFLGSSPSEGGGSRKRRGDDVFHPLKVSLEDLYKGTFKKLSLSRNVICSKCKGKGSKSGESMKSSGCKGSGRKVPMRQLFMVQQKEFPCNDCKVTGERVNDKDRCPQCKGKKVVQEKQGLGVKVEKGMRDGYMITFPGQADEAPDTVTGDVVFVIQQQKHPKFDRRGDDLFFEHTLSLTEALCGFQLVFTHFDGRKLLIKSQSGEVVKPGQFKVINDEGMPIYHKPFMKGILYIRFTIDFPSCLTPFQCKLLEAVLTFRTSAEPTDKEVEECDRTTLHDVNMEEEIRWKEKAAREADDEDNDMHHGGAQRVQCSQQ